nr:hypothetical protein [Tanacetum cinerariifolium]
MNSRNNSRFIRIILVIMPEHQSDIFVILTVTMEILLEPTSNELLVGDVRDFIWIELMKLDINLERAEVYYYECKEPFKSLKCLSVRSKSIAATWLEKVVTPLIEPAIKGFAAASAVLKPEHLKVDKHNMSEPMSYYLID